MTQTWLCAELVAGDSETYEAITCLACSKQHFVCLASGHVLGEDEAHPSLRRVPVAQPKQVHCAPDRPASALSSDRVKEKGAAVRSIPDLPKAC